MTNRLHGLDSLRGICAIGVAIYHFRLWSGLAIPQSVEGLLTLFGTYGVSIFFILSGYSLAHAYESRFRDTVSADHVLSYLRRRLGRLAPLFALTVLLSVAGKIVSGGNVPDLFTAVASISLVFGFVDPADTPVIGGWSIGVEVVFYAFFPLLLLLRRHAAILFLVSVFLTAWISWQLADHPDLPSGWRLYVHPANQMVFFAGGVFLRLHARSWSAVPLLVWATLIVGIIVASVFLAMGASELDMTTGWRRALLVSGALFIVMGVGTMNPSDSRARISTTLGGLSYPLYLLHPLIFFLSLRLGPMSAVGLTALIGAGVIVAIIVDKFADMPLQMRLRALRW